MQVLTAAISDFALTACKIGYKYGKSQSPPDFLIKNPKKLSDLYNYQLFSQNFFLLLPDMKKKTQEFLEAQQSEMPSTWREEAEWRRDNWSWLRHSQKIAVKVLLQMKQEGLTQNALAERMDCTQQYVSKILKGKENMSLDTLSKLEDALGINLIYDEQVAYPNMVAEEVFA